MRCRQSPTNPLRPGGAARTAPRWPSERSCNDVRGLALKAGDVLAGAAALGEHLVDLGYVRERVDLGDRGVQPAFGDQVEDATQAGGGAVRCGSPQAVDTEAADREVAADQPSGWWERSRLFAARVAEQDDPAPGC